MRYKCTHTQTLKKMKENKKENKNVYYYFKRLSFINIKIKRKLLAVLILLFVLWILKELFITILDVVSKDL